MVGENLANNSESEEELSSGVESLAELVDDFDPVAAAENIAAAKGENNVESREKDALESGETTVAVYLEDGSSMTPGEMKKKKGDPEAYTAERQAWHDEVIKEAVEAVKQLSEIMGEPPRIIAARGGCGSGKTTAFKELFKKIQRGMELFDEKGDIPGAVKPDYFKDVIKDEARESLGVEVTSSQAHMESTGICRMFAEVIKNNPDLSMVIDKQLEAEGDIPEIIEWGRETGKSVELLDNDVPIELSAFRVLKRKIGGADPNIEFSGVARGFVGIRANRGQVLEDVKEEVVSVYSLRAFDPKTKQQMEIAKKMPDGKIVYVPGYEELGGKVGMQNREEAEAEAEQARNQVITEEYVEEFVSRYFDESNGPTKYSNEARKVLGAYAGLGITFGEALDSKAAGINPDRNENGELIDTNYREKVVAFVARQREAKAA